MRASKQCPPPRPVESRFVAAVRLTDRMGWPGAAATCGAAPSLPNLQGSPRPLTFNFRMPRFMITTNSSKRYADAERRT